MRVQRFHGQSSEVPERSRDSRSKWRRQWGAKEVTRRYSENAGRFQGVEGARVSGRNNVTSVGVTSPTAFYTSAAHRGKDLQVCLHWWHLLEESCRRGKQNLGLLQTEYMCVNEEAAGVTGKVQRIHVWKLMTLTTWGRPSKETGEVKNGVQAWWSGWGQDLELIYSRRSE